ncbi:MAG: HD family phosphohydrolase [Desulfatibacillaceae bacterium]
MKETTRQRLKNRILPPDDRLSMWMLVAAAAVMALLLYPDLMVTDVAYEVGDVAEKNIKAPREFLIEDTGATEANRLDAVEAVRTVYDFDDAMDRRVAQRVTTAFDRVRETMAEFRLMREEARKAAEEAAAVAAKARAEALSATAVQGGAQTAEAVAPMVSPGTREGRSLEEALWEYKPVFERDLGISVSDGAYGVLIAEEFAAGIPRMIVRIVQDILDNGVVANKEILLEEADKGIILRGIESGRERHVQSLRQFYSLDQAKTMVRVVGKPLVSSWNYNLVNLVMDFSQRLIRPNLTMNRSETQKRRDAAAAQIKPVLFKIKAGEMLLREGERVTRKHLLKLEKLRSHVSREQVAFRTMGIGALILAFLVTFYFVFLKIRARGTPDKKDVALICLVLLFFFLVAKVASAVMAGMTQESLYSPYPTSVVFGTPLAAGAMVVCMFLGMQIALPFAVLMTFCVTALFENTFEIFAYFLINSTLAAYWVRDCKEHNVFIRAGVKVGLLNAGLILAIYLHRAGIPDQQLAWDLAFGFLGGVGAGVLTAGIVPLVEVTFGYTTDMSLLELSNLDRPLLQRLMIEAPGTYHHSVIVGSLVEAAAAQIGANPLLAKVCGYYHDIGKIKKPLYFIENQMGGKNRHDKLAPSMSALILIGHVRDGVEMAREKRLRGPIVDAIQQHHGTSLITFFYEKAKTQRGEENVRQDDFRYPGPKPQTKETGLVMLADVVEAASRSLENPTSARIQGLVQRLINKIFSDGQLDDCELTLKDLHQIARSFNKILTGIYHHRVEYTETPPKGVQKGKRNGAGTDKEQSKQAQNRNGEDKKQGEGGLRRLGLS